MIQLIRFASSSSSMAQARRRSLNVGRRHRYILRCVALSTTVNSINSKSVTTTATESSTSTETTSDGPPPPQFNLYNSLSQSHENILELLLVNHENGESSSPDSNNIRKDKNSSSRGLAWYACGPTTYAPAHLGHARTYIWLDIFRRCLEYYHHIIILSSSSTTATSSTPLSSRSHCHNRRRRPPPPPLPIFVMNITDVDDKILQAAAAEEAENGGGRQGGGVSISSSSSSSPLELARRFETEFWKDMDALNVQRPHIVTRVTEHVSSHIVPYIEKLVEAKMAYIRDTNGDDKNDDDSSYGSVYFDVRAYEDQLQSVTRYGKLAPPAHSCDFYTRLEEEGEEQLQQDQLQQPTLEDNSSTKKKRLKFADKRDPRDFCLWKIRKDGERMYWDSPWGPGRPGWHIECSAMIHAVQSDLIPETHAFGLHAGGVDLKFPHHTNEIAQAEAFYFSQQMQPKRNPREWIPHWMHTGHLYIDGLKMSKSLKNFITIREMIEENETSSSLSPSQSALWSPADDFRLWCLGLSGSYRDAATYSSARLKEARRVREQMVRFLLDGEEWLLLSRGRRRRRGSRGGEDDGGDVVREEVKKLNDQDRDLLVLAQSVPANCITALSSDLDGTVFVKELMRLVSAGRTYLDATASASAAADSPSSSAIRRPSEPLRAALTTVRNLLSLVGFSDATCRAGMDLTQMGTTDAATTSPSPSNVVGGERALLDEICRFRAAVRKIAVSGLKKLESASTSSSPSSSSTSSSSLKEILTSCDDARDKVFPAMGIELLDVRIDGGDGDGDLPSYHQEGASAVFWKYCLPRSIPPPLPPDTAGATAATSPKAVLSLSTSTSALPSKHSGVPLFPEESYFQMGQYEGQFAEFDQESGLPIRHADGSEVSNRLRKKLQKKLDKHRKKMKVEEEAAAAHRRNE